jgi:hypothetical protein
LPEAAVVIESAWRKSASLVYSSDLHHAETDLEGIIDPQHRSRIEGAQAPLEPLPVYRSNLVEDDG